MLGVPYPGGYDASFDRSTRGLVHAPRVASYRGFVFASLGGDGITLEQHLGKAVRLIDRSCDLSPDVPALEAAPVRSRHHLRQSGHRPRVPY